MTKNRRDQRITEAIKTVVCLQQSIYHNSITTGEWRRRREKKTTNVIVVPLAYCAAKVMKLNEFSIGIIIIVSFYQ